MKNMPYDRPWQDFIILHGIKCTLFYSNWKRSMLDGRKKAPYQVRITLNYECLHFTIFHYVALKYYDVKASGDWIVQGVLSPWELSLMAMYYCCALNARVCRLLGLQKWSSCMAWKLYMMLPTSSRLSMVGRERWSWNSSYQWRE